MAFSTKSARRDPMSAELQDWCDSGDASERRTVVLTLSPTADPDTLRTRLEELGAEIVSAGPGATIATLPQTALSMIRNAPGIVRIEAPGRLSPKAR